MLIRQLPVESALVRALNDGRVPWGQLEHLVADHWALTLQINSGEKARFRDHPVRAEMQQKARAEAQRTRVVELRTKFDQRKQKYGLG